MATRRVTRFHPKRSVERNPSFWRKVQLRWGAILFFFGSLPVLILLIWIPYMWADRQIGLEQMQWGNEGFTAAGRVEEHWVSLPLLKPFLHGDEPAVKAFLARQPLVTALMERAPGRMLWLRLGDRLVPATNEPEAYLYRSWIQKAEAAQRFQFVPPPETLTPSAAPPAIVLLGERWAVVKRWVPGSPRVEEALRLVFPNGCGCRFGLILPEQVDRTDLVPQEWGRAPNLQADPARLVHRWFVLETKSDALGPWLLRVIPTPEVEGPMAEQVQRHFWMATAFSIFIALGMGLGLWLRRRARLRAILDADRLASLTHSLKTPLAILKFRCDSLRLGRLSPDEADAQLMKLGEEVDHLALLIENGLDAIRGHSETGPQGEVTPAWLTQVAEDIAPAFEAEGRSLELAFGSDSGRATLPSLRSALLTLLENALHHGKGVVTFRSSRSRRKLLLQIHDEGPGLEPHQLEALGRPFLRLRIRGHEGFLREGQGLGLSLLVQVARKEGWGLLFESAPGQGLTATLEIPLA